MKLTEKKAALATLLTELEKAQEEITTKGVSQSRGDEINKKFAEAKALQDEVDQAESLIAFNTKNRQIGDNNSGDDNLPAARDSKSRESAPVVAGYVSAGELFINSELYRAYKNAGAPAGKSTEPVILAGKSFRDRFVPLSVEQRKAVEKVIRESKAVPTLGSGVIEPTRIADVVRVTEQDALRLRDVLNISQTDSDAIKYLRMTSYTRAAAPVAASASKPEAAIAFDTVTEAVKTLAVWMPVTEQMLQDAPQVRNAIDTELLYDLDKVVEEEVIYGDGTGEHFTGITNTSGVLAGRTVAGDTLLDKIRRSITDVRKAGYSPNAVVLDPIDWEGIELLKGSDDRYVWAIIRDTLGPRVWGLNVVETVAAEANNGDTTEERNAIVGDFIRGATLWDRQQSSVQVGWVNDQFIKNQRTLRAELRAAFGVKRPKAFRTITTQVAVP